MGRELRPWLRGDDGTGSDLVGIGHHGSMEIGRGDGCQPGMDDSG